MTKTETAIIINRNSSKEFREAYQFIQDVFEDVRILEPELDATGKAASLPTIHQLITELEDNSSDYVFIYDGENRLIQPKYLKALLRYVDCQPPEEGFWHIHYEDNEPRLHFSLINRSLIQGLKGDNIIQALKEKQLMKIKTGSKLAQDLFNKESR